MQVLAGLGCVDWVIAFSQDTPEQLIAELLPDILVKGGDYTPETIAGAQQILKHGGQVKILDFIPGCSTTGILQRAQMQAVPVTQHSMEIEP
jgi:D-beta-D-heptose 7-phosphate kinase/D-beta-D-heptose 1-phosphate adenosyltransferase